MTGTTLVPASPDPSWHRTARTTYRHLIAALERPAVRCAADLAEFAEALVSAVPELRRAFGARPHVFTYMFQALARRDPDRAEEAVRVFIDLYVSEFPEDRLRPGEGQ
ncbi:hypothetical protein QZN11_40350 [Streptomyces gramineus]|uniref:hypothetical protein n=1 Tax=Streptomyces gramineus TaxID=910542 RepID=UPI00398B412B